MKIIDAIGIALIVLGIAMTVLNIIAIHKPVAGGGQAAVHETGPRGAVNNL
ncbi:MAG: hypothetical protein ACREDM_11205 [Methylocella sp.]